MAGKNSWLLADVIEPRSMSVVMVGDRVRSGAPLSSVVTRNQERLIDVVRACARSKTTVNRDIPGSRRVTAVPVIERIHDRVHGVWVCTHGGDEPVTVPSPSWAFSWDLAKGFAYRGDAVGMSATWADLGVPVSRPIADALRVFDMGEHNTSALAGLACKSSRGIARYTVVERRSGGDRRVHFVVHSGHELPTSGAENGTVRLLRGLSVDIGAAPVIAGAAPALGDRIAEALTPRRRYRAIADPDSLNLLYWHGPPAPRIAWMVENTVGTPILHPDDRPAAMKAAETLRVAGPGRAIELTVRFLTVDGFYEPFELSVSMFDLDSGQRALLVVLTVE